MSRPAAAMAPESGARNPILIGAWPAAGRASARKRATMPKPMPDQRAGMLDPPGVWGSSNDNAERRVATQPVAPGRTRRPRDGTARAAGQRVEEGQMKAIVLA